MDSKRILDQLLEAQVIGVEEDAESIFVLDNFKEDITHHSAKIERSEDPQLTNQISRMSDDLLVEALTTIAKKDPQFVSIFLTLKKWTTGLGNDELVQASTVLNQLYPEPPRKDGSPEGFIPIHGDQLEFLFKLHPRSVLYVWRDNCDPCDLLKETFEDILKQNSYELSFFSVYGPNSEELLADRFDVKGGPVTLFVLNGTVDSRFYGAVYPEAIIGELNHLEAQSDNMVPDLD